MNELTANDVMLARFKAAWDAGAASIVGYEPEVIWPQVSYSKLQDATKINARLNIAASNRQKMTLGPNGFYKVVGSLFVYVNAPTADRTASNGAQKLAYLVQKAFEGLSEPDGLWYREVVVRNMPTDGSWFQYRAEVRFEVHELT